VTIDSIHQLQLALSSLSIYRNLLMDPVIKKFSAVINCLNSGGNAIDFVNFYNDFFYSLASVGTSFRSYIIEQIIYDDNPYSNRCTRGMDCSGLAAAVAKDLNSLQLIADLSSAAIKAEAQKLNRLDASLLDALPDWELSEYTPSSSGIYKDIKELLDESRCWSDCLPALSQFYREVGAGIFARFYAFYWDGKNIQGVNYPDQIKLKDLFGYEREKAEVIENTRQFLQGCPANNVLLYGDRGTGKSSTVKALVNEYHDIGLRIVEVPKAHLSDFPEIVRILRGRAQKFIIFVDDLSFEDSTENYTALKAVLEGGLESRPDNMLIYATSNRRHLIRENFSDRPSPEAEEIHKNDAVQEKLSLSDRFGITVIFTAPDQDKYLKIISALAQQRGIDVPQNILHREALRWADRHNGRSPRTARQFIDWFEGHLTLQEQP
jgi:predicted AAA+ superfamily ATPase